ncbi:ABC transporter substrate-binding protein [Clostridium sp. MCC353]|uniref:ABC transporter substrate-binding protein n=1 Tax=Clostridium sp. MCC353 TaxID=2592646 RepID=UPI001C01CA46|nr:ABC transporter substrate-binding protein [Clostridium sp. MCC353]
MKKMTAVCLAAAMVLTSAACGGSKEPAPAQKTETAVTETKENQPAGETAGSAVSAKDTIIMASNVEPATLDPSGLDSASIKRVYCQVFDQLFRYDGSSANIVPYAVESYEMDDDNLGITLHLRKDIVFHNGDKADADDLVFTLAHYKGSSIGATLDFINFDDVTKTDDYSVHVGLNYSFGALLDSLVKVSLFSESATTEKGGKFGQEPVGSGPYKFVKWVSGDNITLEANEDYWNGAPAIKNMIIRLISEQSVQMIELEAGTIDVALDPLNSDVADLLSKGSETLKVNSGGEVVVLFMACNYESESGIMKDKRVRQAIAYAINTEDVAAVAYDGTGKGATGLIPPGVLGYDESLKEGSVLTASDIDKAKALLSEAGYPDGVTLTMVNANVITYTRAAEVIQNQLAKIGITLDITTYDDATASSMQEGDFKEDLCIRLVNINGDPIVSPYGTHFEPAKGVVGGRNVAKNANDPETEELQKTIDELKVTFEPDKKVELLKEAQKICNENMWWIPLSFASLNEIQNTSLKGNMKVVNYEYMNKAYFE